MHSGQFLGPVVHGLECDDLDPWEEDLAVARQYAVARVLSCVQVSCQRTLFASVFLQHFWKRVYLCRQCIS